MTLHLVCDTSGSMGDGGKPLIVRTLVLAVAQWARFESASAELTLSGWGAHMRAYPDWHADLPYPEQLLACEGESNGESLTRMLEAHSADTFLLFTDGFWQGGEKQLKRWRGCLPPGALRIVRIGVDANPRIKGDCVFAAEDLLAALDGWPEGGRP